MRTASEAASRGREAFGRGEVFILVLSGRNHNCQARGKLVAAVCQKNRILKEKPNFPKICKNNTEERDRSKTRSKTQPYLGVAKTLEDTTWHEADISGG